MRLLWKLVILLPVINTCAGDGRLSRPIFTQEPHDVTFPLGLPQSEITLTCAANSYPSPHYRWQKNGTDIDFAGSYHYRLDGGNLVVSRPHTDRDAGTYQCLATNPLGTILSRKAKLQFAYIEDFETRSRSTVSVREGQGVVLLCGPPPHFGALSYAWTFNDNPLYVQEDNRRFVSQETGNLYIAKVEPSDVGNYTCFVTNKEAQRSVQGPPTPLVQRPDASAPDFSKNPIKKNSVVQVGGDIAIECKPNAFPRAAVTWKRGTDSLRQSRRVFLLEDGSLKIHNVSRSDAGSYTCVATNQFGVARHTGSLVVKERTVITVPPSQMDVTVGESIVLPCQVSHDPSVGVAFVWSFNGHIIDLEKGVAHFERIGGESVGDLMIRNIQLNHSGKYLCMVQTTLESLSAVADIIVRGPPGPPEDVRVDHISSTTSQLSWRPGLDNNSPIQIFTVQARTPFSVGWQAVSTVPEILSGKTYNATAVGLSPWVDYEFRVVAGNSVGIGEPSKPSELLRTRASVPVVAPTNINGGGGSRSELVITWEPVPEELQNGGEFGYLVMLRPVGSATWTKERVPSVDSARFVYRNESVAPLSPFEVKVGVYNTEGEGALSAMSVIYSGEDEPQLAPRGTAVQSSSASEMEVSWNAIAWNRNTGRVLGYEVLYWTDDSREPMIGKIRVSGNVTAKTITGLRANTVYFASVRAYNTGGTGPSSPPVNVTTKKSPPSQPPANIAWKLTNSKLCLNWEHVKTMENESEVLGYKILYRQNRQSKTHVLETNNTSAELLVPFEEDYLIEIRTVSDGGDGSSSEEIRIPKMSSLSSRGVPVLEPSIHFLFCYFYCFAIFTVLLSSPLYDE
ncbi:contactin-6 isoform 4-T5 [Hipposideros larvatus]